MNCFSQKDTIRISQNDARKAVKELIEYDYQKLEIANLEDQIIVLEKRLSGKDSEIGNLEGQKEVLNSVVNLKDSTILKYEKIIKKQKNTSFIYKIGTAIGVISTIIFAIKG